MPHFRLFEKKEKKRTVINYISYLAIPTVLLFAAIMILFIKKNTFDEFLVGIKDGMELSLSLMPTFIILMVGVSMVSASGLPELLAKYLEPVGERVGVPVELIPLIILRPISGSGSNAVLADIFEKYGADSFVGCCASVFMASSETMIYVITVYFASVKVKKTGYAIPAASIVMLICIYLSCAVCKRILF